MIGTTVDAETLRGWLGDVCDGQVTDWSQLVSGNSRESFAATVLVQATAAAGDRPP